MSDFIPFSRAVHNRYNKLAKQELFVTTEDKDALVAHYLASFPEGTNPIYKSHTEHDCSCCKNFIKNIGNLVGIVDGKIETVWQVTGLAYPYDVVAKSMDEYVRAQKITNVFRTTEGAYGAEMTKQMLEDGSVKKWNHFHAKVGGTHLSAQAGELRGAANTNVQTLKRGLEELPSDAISQVLELIGANALYRGQEHLRAVQGFAAAHAAYQALDAAERELFLWANHTSPAAHFRNSVIGTLIQDLTDTDDLEGSVKRFEAKVAPANYKRPTALVTPRMVEAALQTIKDLDYEDSLQRRMACISDVGVTNVLWVNNETQAKMRGGIENVLMAAAKASVKPKEVRAEDISIDDFMVNVLPNVTGMELLVKNKHIPNFMTLTAPAHDNTKPLFVWPNNFAWSYSGNMADSDLRAAVQARGGRVDGAFRFSHSWNHKARNASLMDLHVFMPGWRNAGRSQDSYGDTYGNNERVGWNHRNHRATGGTQDVDYTSAAPEGYVPVENITFPDVKLMPEGTYICRIHNWKLREPTRGGFKAEIEFGGQVFEYEYEKPLGNKEWVDVAHVTLRNGAFTIDHKLPTTTSSQEKWGVTTEQFVKVNTLMHSPNFWDGNAVGNKHWFFMLEGCKNDQPTRGIYNEFLTAELSKHRKVFELLGDKTKCPPTDNQLSGVGFSSTSGAEVTVKVTGTKLNRIFNVKF